ncbi:MAG TPA: AAA family ATPase [Abditibacteriaceae bacterium]|jgi:predicted ATPase/signal transduction histidine kinase/tRNA A-37 threonylcarbamoyl transferase component Bud32
MPAPNFSLPGCRFSEVLHEDLKTGIYRGTRGGERGGERDGLPVIVKTLRAALPSLEDVARLRHEYEIMRDLPFKGVLQPLDLIKHEHGVALLLEDFGAVSLRAFLQNQSDGLELPLFFDLALELVNALEQIHARHILHRDINPGNILVNPQTRQIKISDFGIASRLSQESVTGDGAALMRGTLSYMSPEQTGRMNQPVDYRTDFYSLGVTFYEMLTGHLPFEASDLLGIVHAHIAKVAPPPHEVRAEIPPLLSQIVLKMLSKTVQERYQSARGLSADLEACRAQWQAGSDTGNFALGRHDASSELRISHKLYGRENEVLQLLQAFERSTNGGREMVLVAGFSGIGKTSVVQEINKPIAQRRGFFVGGKFDQFRRDVPYSALIQAFQELIHQVLTQSEERVAHFKAHLIEAFGPNGQLLIEVIPELELIVGPQPPVPDLGPQETLNRFNFVLSRFVRVWAQAEHPLALFLDDLQWAGGASLNFLQTLMGEGECHHLLIVGAYRDNEVSSSHPLMLALDEIRKIGAPIQEITLVPLEADHVSQLLEDTLRCSRADAEPLAALLLQRTEGNPFFINQLLQSLHDENLLRFEDGKWRWDLEAIGQANLTGDIVELMGGKIKKLPAATQDAVKLAACIGNRFDSRTLSLVQGQSAAQVGADLWEALRAGLITPLSGNYQMLPLLDETSQHTEPQSIVTYKFLHDRVQQAAYSAIEESQRPALHLKIGRLLLENASKEERDDKLFDITGHLNEGRALIEESEELHRLVRLNLQAGLKAKASAAHSASVQYFALAQEIAPQSLWQDDYATMFRLARERSESEYLEGHFEQAETQFGIALSHAQNVLERAAVERIRIQLYITRGEYLAAVKVGLDILSALGLVLPARPSQRHVVQELARSKWHMRGLKIADLQNAPRLTDVHQETILSLLASLGAAAYLASEQTLFSVMVLKSVNITLRYGNSDYAAQAFAFYGLMLGSGLGDYNSGDQWGRLSLKLAEDTGSAAVKCVTYFVYPTYLSHWRRPVEEGVEFFWQAYQFGLEAGDLVYSGYSIVSAILQRATSGLTLNEQLETIEKYSGFLHWTKEANQLAITQLVRQSCLNLQGRTAGRTSLDGEGFEEKRVLSEVWSDTESGTGRCAYYITKLRLFYLWGDYPAALDMARQAERLILALLGQIWVPEANFFYSLSLAALYPQATEADKKAYWKQLRKNQKQMKRWAANSPENYAHKHFLVAAEMARLKDRNVEAAGLYDAAIRAAQESGYTQNEALSNEIAARFYQSHGRAKIAQIYLEEAHYLYEKWGASAKVAVLEEAYPMLTARRLGGNTRSLADLSAVDMHHTTDSLVGENTSLLDLATVIRAAQAISGEIDLQRLLQQLLRFALENAGATRGLLLLERDGQWRIATSGSLEQNAFALEAQPEPSASGLSGEEVPLSLVQYVARTRQHIVLQDAGNDELFGDDAYIAARQPKAVLCAPIIHQGRLTGLIYLENNLAVGAFTPAHLEVLNVLSSQAAISLQNAELYGQLEDYSRTLEERVEERTLEVRSKNAELETALHELKEMQNRIIEQQKMASLGVLTAGIAHEIKNPLNFVNTFAALSLGLVNEVNEEIEKVKGHLSDADREYLDEILGDLQGNMTRINEHGKRADSIVRNMLMHSRGQSSQPESVQLNDVVREAVQLAYHGQRARNASFNVTIEENYASDLPLVCVFPQEISRVVLNIAGNACYAVQEKLEQQNLHQSAAFSPTLSVRTKALEDAVEIHIGDNGQGISPEVREKIFNPFFTTKPTGEGTGLGLSMSYDIIVQQHAGQISVNSTPGQGTEFIITLPKTGIKVS